MTDQGVFQDAICPKHGPYHHTELKNGVFYAINKKCPKCAEEARIGKAVTNALIPPRFANKTFENYQVFHQGQKDALAKAQEFCEDIKAKPRGGINLILSGSCGTGKTHLACAVLRETIRSSKTGMYMLNDTMLRRIKSRWDNAKGGEDEIIEKFSRVDLLVIDEVGMKENSFPWERDSFFEVINGRYEQMLPTIIVSNLSVTGEISIKSYVGQRSFDRLIEHSKVILMNWESFRTGETL